MRPKRLLGVLVVAFLVGLVSVAAAVTVTRSGGKLTIKGTGGDDTVVIENIAGIANPMQRFYEIHDPAGIPNPVPPGCFRFDVNTIHCPVDLVDEIVVDLGAGDDELFLGPNIVDDLEAEGDGGNDELEGGDLGDDLEGGAGDDIVRGHGANDQIDGGSGRDRLFGGGGRDRISGGGGRDRLNGGGGRDRCNGGAGNDTQRSCEIGANY